MHFMICGQRRFPNNRFNELGRLQIQHHRMWCPLECVRLRRRREEERGGISAVQQVRLRVRRRFPSVTDDVMFKQYVDTPDT